uniref:G-protein coupled receptors family 1 profile domain-containing protein n=1 Tax=Chinchilla lanigera TaxID=34839 RepID=A0A8C2UPY2_CHILA
MGVTNQSIIAEFVLLGLSDQPMLEKAFFVLILSMYLVILLGNGVLILVTILDSHLHTLFIFVSYVFILTTILRIPSAEGRKKAFSTCSAHLTVVIIFYGTILFMYGKPKSKDPLGADKQDLTDKLISLFYGVLTPMLNPIIYSLRNKDVKAAVKNLVSEKCFTQP